MLSEVGSSVSSVVTTAVQAVSAVSVAAISEASGLVQYAVKVPGRILAVADRVVKALGV